MYGGRQLPIKFLHRLFYKFSLFYFLFRFHLKIYFFVFFDFALFGFYVDFFSKSK